MLCAHRPGGGSNSVTRQKAQLTEAQVREYAGAVFR